MTEFQDWALKYNGIIADLKRGEGCIEQFNTAIDNRKVVLYGANTHGKTLFKLFRELGIEIHAYVDRNAQVIGQVFGVPVHEPQWLRTLGTPDDYVLFSATNPQNRKLIAADIVRFDTGISSLEDGFSIHTPLQTAVCTRKLSRGDRIDLPNCSSCSIMNHTCPILKGYLKKLRGFDEEKTTGASNQTSISYILGKKCSLKCIHCVEMLPYIAPASRTLTPKESVIGDIVAIARSSTFITVLDFVGGEPFLHPDLVEILETVKTIPNIGLINIFTNGTVVPHDELCSALKDERVTVCVQSYEANLTSVQIEKVLATEAKLSIHEVLHSYSQNITWFDNSSFAFIDDNEEILKKRFSKCVLANCQRVDNGVMYRCVHQYAGVVTGKLNIADERIKVHDYDERSLAEKLDWFNRLDYISTCKYCALPFKAEVVPSGVQLKRFHQLVKAGKNV